jgi:hypothetical protein
VTSRDRADVLAGAILILMYLAPVHFHTHPLSGYRFGLVTFFRFFFSGLLPCML